MQGRRSPVREMTTAPMRVMPVRVAPSGITPPGVVPSAPIGTSPVRIIPSTVPSAVPRAVPSQSQTPSRSVPGEVQAEVELTVESPTVVSRAVPEYGPDVFGIGPENKGGIERQVCVGRKPPVPAVIRIYVPVRTERKVKGDVLTVGEKTETFGVTGYDSGSFFQIAFTPFKPPIQ